MSDLEVTTIKEQRAAAILRKLLGSLEIEVMKYMWQMGEATVQEVKDAIGSDRQIAYTTVMTVMGHLVNKELLSRVKEGKRYRYQAVWSREEFLKVSSRNMVRALLNDFGDIAIAGFLGEIDKVNSGDLEQLRKLSRGESEENSPHPGL
ncbi:MAG: BlaI/MecI/CopY family transcriptional regulator [Chloroflexi bacterium]|nr:BlaI/MecI/CopY family transcriptional regulator [Chloroflexota bacterium]